MKELANQTIRLCGLNPEVWRAQRENVRAVVLAQVPPTVSTHVDDGMDVDVEVMDLFDIFT